MRVLVRLSNVEVAVSRSPEQLAWKPGEGSFSARATPLATRSSDLSVALHEARKGVLAYKYKLGVMMAHPLLVNA
jgi:hypothetical protein